MWQEVGWGRRWEEHLRGEFMEWVKLLGGDLDPELIDHNEGVPVARLSAGWHGSLLLKC